MRASPRSVRKCEIQNARFRGHSVGPRHRAAGLRARDWSSARRAGSRWTSPSPQAPIADTVESGRLHALTPVVRIGAAVASLSVLLSLLAGVSRTTFAMARERDLPAWLDAVHSRYHVPHRAELVIGAVVALLAATVDLRSAIGFSAFAVLLYYTIANASAWTLSVDERRWSRWIATLGIVGCVSLAISLPSTTLLAGGAMFAIGIVFYIVRGRWSGPVRGVGPAAEG